MAETLDLVIPAGSQAPSRVRRAVTDWLCGVCGHPALCDTGEDLLYAVSEAVANTVDHAYSHDDRHRGSVSVLGQVAPPGLPDVARDGCTGEFRIEFVIVDTGRWKEPSADPGGRGRGLQMMRALVDRCEVTRALGGTTVTLRRVLSCAGGDAA